jgi:hypothetical protein
MVSGEMHLMITLCVRVSGAGDKHAVSLFVGMCVIYIILQTFCIPGSGTTLNLLAGCIYAEYMPLGEYLIALPYCVFCSTVKKVKAHAIIITCKSKHLQCTTTSRIMIFFADSISSFLNKVSFASQ